MPALRISLCLLSTAMCLQAQAFHQRQPNSYKQTAADNAVTELNQRLQSGGLELEWEPVRGRLRALLSALGVPASSQTLVFSKTSLQRHRISPKNPRALYFNDDVYVGWIPGAASLEVAVGDPKLGLAFYSLPQDPDKPAQLLRDDTCLSCHATSRTLDEPGLLLRSVFPDDQGDPIPSAGESDMDYRSPIAERWGGWLVTGKFEGDHRGNGVATRRDGGGWQVPPRPAQDLRAFEDDFDAARYLKETSDIGALLALEQQVTVHNLLIRAGHQMRYLIEKDRVMQALLQTDREPPSTTSSASEPSESTARIATTLANQITAAMLLEGEAPLAPHNVQSDPDFAREYAALWTQPQTKSQLGILDLSEHTFTLRLSPMIHSRAFQRLPISLRDRVLSRMQVAIERGVPPGDVRMDPATRRTLTRHLRATVPGWPAPLRHRRR